MGYQNAQAVVQLWSDLPGGQFKLLIAMAIAAHDGTGRCWLGAEEMAAAMGNHGAVAHDSSGQTIVRRALVALQKRGAIIRLTASTPGSRAEWQLQLARPDSPALAVDNHPAPDGPVGTPGFPVVGTPGFPVVGTPGFPGWELQGSQVGNSRVPPYKHTHQETRDTNTHLRNPATHQTTTPPVDNSGSIRDWRDVPLPLDVAAPRPTAPEIVPLTTETSTPDEPVPGLAPVIQLRRADA